MRLRTWPILAGAFGTLLVILVLSATDTARRVSHIFSGLLASHDAYVQTERVLNDVQAGVYQANIYVRDFLLDPSHLTAPMYRERLHLIQTQMNEQLDLLMPQLSGDQKKTLEQLRSGLESFWKTMDPIFDWTPQQKILLSAQFLRREVLPRREAVLSMAKQIAQLNSSTLKKQQAASESSIASFRRYVIVMMALAIGLSVAISFISGRRIWLLERRAEEQHARTEHAERELRRLSQQLVRAQEEERRTISRELHDEVGQTLTGLRYELASLETLREAPADQFRDHLSDAKSLAERTLQSVRALAMGLRPSMLDDLGLGPAHEWQAREFSRRTGIPVDVLLEGLPGDLPDAHRTCVYRVVQEALTNCARHAHASHIRIAVHSAPDALTLTVQDDGVGIGKRAPAGLGLVGIEERVKELGGSVTLQSQPGKGTLLRAELPLPGVPEETAV